MNPLEALRMRIDAYKEQLAEHLLSGGAKDHTQYMNAVAKVTAFDRVLEDISEIEKQYLED